MPSHTTTDLQKMLQKGRIVAGLTQAQWGDIISVSSRTVMRIEKGVCPVTPMMLCVAAREVYPHHRELAVEMATAGGSSIVALGIEAPPDPASPPPAPEAAHAASVPEPIQVAPVPVPIPSEPVAPPPLHPTTYHLVDSVVCAAAESMNTTPQAIRPALYAAFARAREIGLSLEDLEEMLEPEPSGDDEFVHRR